MLIDKTGFENSCGLDQYQNPPYVFDEKIVKNTKFSKNMTDVRMLTVNVQNVPAETVWMPSFWLEVNCAMIPRRSHCGQVVIFGDVIPPPYYRSSFSFCVQVTDSWTSPGEGHPLVS